jgi:Uma2 family endonuclease
LRFELIDGVLLITPPPLPAHQRAVLKLLFRLHQHCPPNQEVLLGPLAFQPTAQLLLQPDALVCRRDDPGLVELELPLLLAVEVVSSATRTTDLVLKRAIYEETGVASYWMFDPEDEVLTVLELVEGRYVERAVVKGEDVFEAELPFPVRISPAAVVR